MTARPDLQRSNPEQRGGDPRLPAVDGLRAVAVLGVIWIHVWFHFGNVAAVIGQLGAWKVDLFRSIAIFGNGVELFFVISGFCMYLSYARHDVPFSWSRYRQFIGRRWWRIAPAFYVVVLATAAWAYVQGERQIGWADLLAHAAFVHTIQPIWLVIGYGYHFWSLATEWQFYLGMPLLVAAVRRYGFAPVILVALIVSDASVLYAATHEPEARMLAYHVTGRLINFVWGMGVAHLFLAGTPTPPWLRSWKGFALAFAVAYVGRVLQSRELTSLPYGIGLVCKGLSDPLMTLGFAGILWNVVTSRSAPEQFLRSAPLQAIGRWSYSIYLWHLMIVVWVSGQVKAQVGTGVGPMVLALAISVVLVIPVAAASYRLLEAPYFRTRRPSVRRPDGQVGEGAGMSRRWALFNAAGRGRADTVVAPTAVGGRARSEAAPLLSTPEGG